MPSPVSLRSTHMATAVCHNTQTHRNMARCDSVSSVGVSEATSQMKARRFSDFQPSLALGTYGAID